ncbi:MAG TPA: TonB-dependent receptor plug domain-containing protein, partial [Puia sp.]|nr:TonB-dependent receptor plug domain-containing protein [Puia sp.]
MKLLKAVKLTMLFLTAACLQVSARSAAQGISLSLKDAPLQKAFALLEKQSGYTFFFNEEWMTQARPVTLKIEHTTLEKALQLCFAGQPFSYEIVNRTVVIKQKTAASSGATPDSSPANGGPPIDVKGRIVNENGEPVLASILVKGTNKGTTSNTTGYFELKKVDPNAVLIISAANIETREIALNGKSDLGAISVKMKTSPLDQVQIIAYGTSSVREQTGNVTTVKGEDIAKQPVTNPLLAIEARVPGLFITQSSGIPGSGVTTRVQGQNSILAGNDPLYVVDGVPYPSQMLTTTIGAGILTSSGGSVVYAPGGHGNPLNYLNPDDIESIEVLKDADATSIYGSRAANGAILITTRKGKAGQSRVDVNCQSGWGKITRSVPVMNTRQYLAMRTQALQNDKLTPNVNSDFDLTLWDTTRYTDWVKTLIGGTAGYLNANASVSGGSNNVQYLIGTTYQKQTNVFPGNFADKRGDVHFNINSTSVNQRFRLQLNGTYLTDDNKLPKNDFTALAYTLPPNAPSLYNADGTLNWAPNTKGNGNSSWTNPLSYLSTLYENQTDNLIGSSQLGYTVLPGLEISSRFGYNTLQTNEYAPSYLLSSKPESRPTSSRQTNYSNSTIRTWLVEPQITFRKRIGNGTIDVLL